MYRSWDAAKYPYKEIMNMFYVLCVLLAQEPKTQIAGIALVGDMSGMTRRHVPSTWADITAWATFMKVQGAPCDGVVCAFKKWWHGPFNRTLFKSFYSLP